MALIWCVGWRKIIPQQNSARKIKQLIVFSKQNNMLGGIVRYL